jgi:hypothetical protein
MKIKIMIPGLEMQLKGRVGDSLSLPGGRAMWDHSLHLTDEKTKAHKEPVACPMSLGNWDSCLSLPPNL